MHTDPEPDVALEIAHLLLIDVVGYSKLLVNEQIDSLKTLNRIVRATESFRAAEAKDKLIRLPTGDGMALLFFESLEQPVRCALEIAEALRNEPRIPVRMGIHSGPVNQVQDVNDRVNIAGSGINVAQRVVDCGDAGHILLSKHVADDLCQYRHWQPYLEDLGECEVKHGLRLHLFTLCKDGLGKRSRPEKLKRGKRWEDTVPVRPLVPVRWPRWTLLIALGLATGALTLSIGIWLRRPVALTTASPAETAPVSERSIAVLPFENLSDERQNAHLPDAVQDEILTDLAKVSDLKVISRTSVRQYKTGQERNVREIAKQLGVAHILEGTVQFAANRVRVTVQLIDARTDTHQWAERYDRDLADVFGVESEVAEKIVGQLKSKLSSQEKAAIEERPTADLVAYDLYLRARDLIDGAVFSSGSELLEATRLLDEATKRDPSFALAYYQLAHAHDQLYLRALDHTIERLNLAKAAIQSLRLLRPDSGEAHLALAKHLYWGYLDYEHARQELTAASRTLPNEPLIFLLSGYIDRRQGRWEGSLKNIERALELDPQGPQKPFMLQQLAKTYELLRRYTDQAAALDRGLALAPDNVSMRLDRAGLELEARADTKPLRSALQALVVEHPEEMHGYALQFLYLARCEHNWDAAIQALNMMPIDGCHEEAFPFPRAWCEGTVARMRGDATGAHAAFISARKEVEQIVQVQPDNAPALCVLGLIDAALGNKDGAIREGRRAVALLPVTKDSINGASAIEFLAMTYAWAGKKDYALSELDNAANIPGWLSYGELRLDPLWDPIRSEPRFQKIIASLAPK
jgi:TolB-like protein/class 3 adenylate cyclase/Flp pilus assembly protein TadD